MKREKVIITCAITGAIPTPTMSEALPITAEQIAEQSIEAANAGAAILHLHARHPVTGQPSIDPKHFMDFLPQIQAETDAVINISTGGSQHASIQERIQPALQASPEMCSMNMGSMNFAYHKLADRYDNYKFDWEEEHIRNSDNAVFRNTFADIAIVANQLGRGHNVKFEHECYDVGHLYNLKFCLQEGMFEPPLFIQFALGVLGGIGAEIDNLLFMKRTADRLFGDNYQWSVLAAGAAQMRLATVAAQLGGNVRVGLEDSLNISRGKLASSNAEQVRKVRQLLEDQGFELSTSAEAREKLNLKGRLDLSKSDF
jgi:uncharacterized protein (DUF849 family)